MSENCRDGLRWNAVVVQARSKSTAEGVKPIPFNAGAFKCWLDALGPKRRQVERENTWTLKDPCRAGILLSMLLEFCNDVRQEMHSGFPMFGLGVDDFLVPHRTHNV